MKKFWFIIMAIVILLGGFLYYEYTTCPVTCSGSGMFKMCMDSMNIHFIDHDKCKNSLSKGLNEFITRLK